MTPGRSWRCCCSPPITCSPRQPETRSGLRVPNGAVDVGSVVLLPFACVEAGGFVVPELEHWRGILSALLIPGTGHFLMNWAHLGSSFRDFVSDAGIPVSPPWSRILLDEPMVGWQIPASRSLFRHSPSSSNEKPGCGQIIPKRSYAWSGSQLSRTATSFWRGKTVLPPRAIHRAIAMSSGSSSRQRPCCPLRRAPEPLHRQQREKRRRRPARDLDSRPAAIAPGFRQ